MSTLGKVDFARRNSVFELFDGGLPGIPVPGVNPHRKDH